MSETETKETNKKSDPTPVASVDDVNAAMGRTPVSGTTAPSPTPTRGRTPARRVSDVIDNQLWPELPKRPVEELLGLDIVIDEFKILHSAEFTSDYAIIKCYDADNNDFTTACGGGVVMDKLKQLQESRNLPITATFKEVTGKGRGARTYYDLV